MEESRQSPVRLEGAMLTISQETTIKNAVSSGRRRGKEQERVGEGSIAEGE